MNNIFTYRKIKSDLLLEFWQQDLYGNGVSLETQTSLMLSKKIGLNFNIGYKTEGYVLGKQLNAGMNLGIGMSYYRN